MVEVGVERPAESEQFVLTRRSALDPAATEFFKDGRYMLSGESLSLTPEEMVDYLAALVKAVYLSACELHPIACASNTEEIPSVGAASITGAASGQPSNARRTTGPSAGGQPVFETLERRSLLSATLESGLLRVDGTAGDDQISIERGSRWFDFGRSTPGSGTYDFKLRWGGKVRQLYWVYPVPNQDDTAKRVDPPSNVSSTGTSPTHTVSPAPRVMARSRTVCPA